MDGRDGVGTDGGPALGEGDEPAGGKRSWNGRKAAIVARLRAGILVEDDKERAQTFPPAGSSPSARPWVAFDTEFWVARDAGGAFDRDVRGDLVQLDAGELT